jgi:chromosome segregation ATPase
MIEWAMLFALGAFASGLLALAVGAIVVRRTRRVTERQVRARLADRRAEFNVERDEERVRFAVETRRLEREAATLRDQATANRLDADIKEQELFNLRADLNDREIEAQDLSERLTESQGILFDTERKLAETGAALRAAQHELNAEMRRRASVEHALQETTGLADERRLEIVALRAENEDLRSSLERLRERLAELGDLRWATEPIVQLRHFMLPAEEAARPEDAEVEAVATDAATDGRVVPLRPYLPPESADWGQAALDRQSPETESIERIAAEIHRIANEAEADLRRVWRVPPVPPRDRERATANGSGHASAGGASAPRQDMELDEGNVTPLRAANEDNKSAEARFLEALEEIRALRRAGGANPAE